MIATTDEKVKTSRLFSLVVAPFCRGRCLKSCPTMIWGPSSRWLLLHLILMEENSHADPSLLLVVVVVVVVVVSFLETDTHSVLVSLSQNIMGVVVVSRVVCFF